MEVWSKGLGNRALNLELGKGEVEIRDNAVVLKGVIGKPVFWDYTITMEKQDIFGFLDVLTDRNFIGFLMGSENRWKMLFAALRVVLKILPAYGKRLLGRRNGFGNKWLPTAVESKR